MTALTICFTARQMDGRLWPFQGSTELTNLVSVAVSGVVMLTQPIVRVLMPDGSLDLSYTGPVTLSSSSGSLGGTTTVLAVAGIATYAGLSITGSGAINLIATVPMRIPGISAAITVT